MKKRVLLGMSGGVDSGVAALILLERGYEVVGATLKLRPDKYDVHCESKTCCSINDVFDARRVAYKLGIDHIVLNFTEAFEKQVIKRFVDEYLQGKTPNPCIYCNKYIKFEALLQRAEELDFDYIATGHYANIEYSKADKRFLLKKSKSPKDQSYVLYNLSQKQLSKTLFPLGNLDKIEVREIALRQGLHIAAKPDSQEICFVPNNNYAEFIKDFTQKDFLPGEFIDLMGNSLGQHKGIPCYTLGQRRGLGVSLGKHMYVAKIDFHENTVTLCDEAHRYIKSIIVDNLNFIATERLDKKTEAQVKIRHQAYMASAVLEPMAGSEKNKKIKVTFLEKQRLTAPGQSAVFYQGDSVIGGGIISEVFLCE